MGKLKLAFLAGALAMAGIAGTASATPLSGTFHIVVYQGTNAGGSINDPEEQANQANPFIDDAYKIGEGDYTGNIDFTSNTNSIAAFLSSGGGGDLGISSSYELSQAGFGLTTVMVITGDVGGSHLYGSISHDDGASLYNGAGYSNLLADSALPTVDIDTLYSDLTGPFQLIYVEANGLPAVLTLDVAREVDAPEPLTLSLMGAGLVGLGGLRRRRSKV